MYNSKKAKAICTVQIATLRIITEQSPEWNASLYVIFIDNGKALECRQGSSMETLWSPRYIYFTYPTTMQRDRMLSDTQWQTIRVQTGETRMFAPGADVFLKDTC